MAQMPEIKGVVNKEPERDKKKAGLFARLFGGGGSGTVGVGGFGGIGGAAGSGGLLATKAGLLALILAGTTVAGGIGVIGYRLFGPGADQPTNGDNLQLFAPKPKDVPAGSGQAGSKDGSSTSLEYARQANPGGANGPDGGAAAAPKDETAAGAAGSAASSGPLNKADDGSNGVNKTMPKNATKLAGFGASGGGGGGGGASASSAAQKFAGGDLSANAHKGSMTAMSKGPSSANGVHAMAGRAFGSQGAAGQAFGALKDNRNATSSAGGGTTYDGSAPGSNIGANGSAIGMPGVTPGTGGGQAKTTAGPATNTNTSTSIPTPPATPEAPWQHAIQEAQMALALGGVLLFLMSKIKNPLFYYALGAVVSVLSLMIISLGAQISGGQYGQKLQGEVLAAAGAGLAAAAVWAMVSGPTATDGTSETKTTTTGPSTPTANGGTTQSVTTSTTNSADSVGPMGINPYVWLGGGAALVGLAGTMMVPPTKYPASDFQNGNPPDNHWFGYQQLPSEAALKKMVA